MSQVTQPIDYDTIANQWLEGGPERRRDIARTHPDAFLDFCFLDRLREGLVAKGEMPVSYLAFNTTPHLPPPHLRTRIGIEVVSTQSQCAEVVALYTTLFTDPDLTTFRKIVSVPPVRSTRTRTVHGGPFTWILRNYSDQTIISAATGVVHRSVASNLRFIELTFFCTSKAYKGQGYGRFMNALVQHHAREVGCTFVLVCASLSAVPFWATPSMGYSLIRSDLKGRVEWYYKENCLQFLNTELLVWHTVDETPCLMALALSKLPPGIDFTK
eukprot:PhF_6_TR19028/c0_g1_i1/m.27929